MNSARLIRAAGRVLDRPHQSGEYKISGAVVRFKLDLYGQSVARDKCHLFFFWEIPSFYF